MNYECTLCRKILPSRSGIWSHLKSKHSDILIQANDEFKLKKRQRLDHYINFHGIVNPIKSFSGRPIDDSIQLAQKIEEKSQIEGQDISLRTLTNHQMKNILKEISMLTMDQLTLYLRNPQISKYDPNQKIDIFEDDCTQLIKFKKFINRLLKVFNYQFNEKLISYTSKSIDLDLDNEQDQFLKTILENAKQYSI